MVTPGLSCLKEGTYTGAPPSAASASDSLRRMNMRAVVVSRLGGPEVLELSEAPRPEPGPGQVLVRVHRAGVTVRMRHLHRNDQSERLVHWTSATVPWDAPDPD